MAPGTATGRRPQAVVERVEERGLRGVVDCAAAARRRRSRALGQSSRAAVRHGGSSLVDLLPPKSPISAPIAATPKARPTLRLIDSIPEPTRPGLIDRIDGGHAHRRHHKAHAEAHQDEGAGSG